MASEKRLAVGGGSHGGNSLKLYLNATDLLRQLRRLEKKVGAKIARKVLRAAGRPILNEARRQVPVKTGDLKASLKIRTKISRFYSTARVMATEPYAHLVEFGTKPHFQKRRKGKTFSRRRLHPGADPKPFLRPAFDNRQAEAVDRAKKILRQAILSVAKGI